MTETKDQRKGWLKDLKVGDQVFVVESRGVFSDYKTLTTVEKITATGRINVGGFQFPPVGSIFKNRYVRLEQATDETIESFYEEQQKAEYIRAINKGIDDKLISKMSKSDLEIIKKTFDKYIETETK